MSRRYSGAVSGTDSWAVRVDPQGDQGWRWDVYPPGSLAYIGGACARGGRTMTRWGAQRAARRALRAEQRLLARRERREAASIAWRVTP